MSEGVHLDPGAYQFRSFEGEIADVRIFDEALSPDYIARVGDEPCTVVLDFREGRVHNNLGGFGPDSGEQAMRFFNVTTFRKNMVDLVVTNLTMYVPKFPER